MKVSSLAPPILSPVRFEGIGGENSVKIGLFCVFSEQENSIWSKMIQAAKLLKLLATRDDHTESLVIPTQVACAPPESEHVEKAKEGPNRCSTCKRRVGLTGFSCRCGNLFCSAHRYSDKHECPYDYRRAAQDAIAKANPVVKAEKLDKI
ncbi:hypothetical protein K7X08_010062 [Anisodus acutangulus]|uniref:AN1-type domain-containing protein n=1 Tax=Anisodus acutangulus TaxID=402998 RepID=A0A9Q1N218_9SOLA|nr:hypothetical protein K7X08_010062 [Anisodus acutangulus]